MRGRRVWSITWMMIIGLLTGMGGGLWYGWVVNPVEYKDTDISHLYVAYQDEYVLMASEAYALDGDLDTARARIALLSLPDPANAVADLAERAITHNAPLSDVQALARLATAMGAPRDTFRPYLPSVDDAS
jgi:hypothetical protein